MPYRVDIARTAPTLDAGKLKPAIGIASILFFLSAFTAIASLFPFASSIASAIANPQSAPSARIADYALAAIGAFALAFAFWQIRRIFADAAEISPFTKDQAYRLRKAAIALCAAAVLQWAALCILCACGVSGIEGFSFAFMPQMSILADIIPARPTARYFYSFELSWFVLAAIAWGFSRLFDHAAQLQENDDFTL